MGRDEFTPEHLIIVETENRGESNECNAVFLAQMIAIYFLKYKMFHNITKSLNRNLLLTFSKSFEMVWIWENSGNYSTMLQNSSSNKV